MRRETQSTAAAGKISPERRRILEQVIPLSNAVVQHLPVLLLAGGVIAGHFAGLAAGRMIASENVPVIGADLGALIGRVVGSLAGALLTLGVLRLYRVKEGAVWPGEAARPYPRVLAVLYLVASAALAAAWLLWAN